MDRKIENALQKGVSFLRSKQLETGEFTTKQWIGDDACIRALIFPIKSVFITSFILHSLRFVDESNNVNSMAQKAIDFLLNEKEEFGLWRFYGQKSEIPFDIDCTVCILVALKQWKKALDFKKIGSVLLTYRNDQNIFNTWIFDKSSSFSKTWQNDVDWVVNANSLYFYNSIDQNLPEIEKYLIKVIKNENFKTHSFYYPSISGIYCLTRSFNNLHNPAFISLKIKLKRYLRKTITERKFQSSLAEAFAIIGLINCQGSKVFLSKSIKKLIDTQRTDGSWENSVFFSVYNPLHPQNLLKWGSEELTTAIVLEAMSKYIQLVEKKSDNY